MNQARANARLYQTIRVSKSSLGKHNHETRQCSYASESASQNGLSRNDCGTKKAGTERMSRTGGKNCKKGYWPFFI